MARYGEGLRSAIGHGWFTDAWREIADRLTALEDAQCKCDQCPHKQIDNTERETCTEVR